MKTLLVCLLTTSCIKSAAFSTSSLGGGGGDGNVTIPDVFKLKKADAIAALRKAGVEGDIDDDGSLCGSTVEGKIIELGEVCYQHPAAGQRQGARLVVSLRVQSEDPRHGDIGRNTEWRLMPNVMGMTYEQALAEMRRAGFEREDRIDRNISDDAGCKPNIVCREYPDAMNRAGLNDGKVLFVGPAPETTRVAVADPRPPLTPPRSEPPPATPVAPPPPPPKPAADQPAPSLFGGAPPPPPPPVTQPKPAADPAKPAYRDGEGHVHGPGGPVYMGAGEPCTSARDHCMRAGGLFAADNVVEGKMFRGVPVFQFENKWWTWVGEPAEPKRLFRTAVAAKIDQVQVGKPVVFFVQEGKDRFLDSEYEMLTSSRWSVAVVAAVGTDTVNIKGWGDVPLDTVRVIVEEKQP